MYVTVLIIYVSIIYRHVQRSGQFVDNVSNECMYVDIITDTRRHGIFIAIKHVVLK
jgi:hypothetical protein